MLFINSGGVSLRFIYRHKSKTLKTSGKVGEVWLPDLLLSLARSFFTGKIVFSDNRKKLVVWMRRGAVTAVRSNVKHTLLGMMLVRFGLLIQNDLKRYLRSFKSAAFKGRFGQYLVNMGVIDKGIVDKLLVRIILYRLLYLFSFNEGEYEICETEDIVEDVVHPLKIRGLFKALERFSDDSDSKSYLTSGGWKDNPLSKEGEIFSHPVPLLVEQLFMSGESGILVVEGKGGRIKRLHILNGRIVGITSNSPEERLGSVIVRLGALKEDEIEEVMLDPLLKGRIGEKLISAGKISYKALQTFLEIQSAMRFLNVLGWSKGKYKFERRYEATCSVCGVAYLLKRLPEADYVCKACGRQVLNKENKEAADLLQAETQKTDTEPQYKLEILDEDEIATSVKPKHYQVTLHPCKDCGVLIRSASKICPRCWIKRRSKKDERFRSIVKMVAITDENN